MEYKRDYVSEEEFAKGVIHIILENKQKFECDSQIIEVLEFV